MRSLPIAIITLALAQRLGVEAVAATELAVREKATVAMTMSQQMAIGRPIGKDTDTILHDVGNVADLYLARFPTAQTMQEEPRR